MPTATEVLAYISRRERAAELLAGDARLTTAVRRSVAEDVSQNPLSAAEVQRRCAAAAANVNRPEGIDADDLAQRVYLAAVRRFGTLTPLASELSAAWGSATAHRIVLWELREQMKRAALLDTETDPDDTPAAPVSYGRDLAATINRVAGAVAMTDTETSAIGYALTQRRPRTIGGVKWGCLTDAESAAIKRMRRRLEGDRETVRIAMRTDAEVCEEAINAAKLACKRFHARRSAVGSINARSVVYVPPTLPTHVAPKGTSGRGRIGWTPSAPTGRVTRRTPESKAHDAANHLAANLAACTGSRPAARDIVAYITQAMRDASDSPALVTWHASETRSGELSSVVSLTAGAGIAEATL